MLNVNFEAMDLRTEIENIVHEILMEGVTKEDAIKELLNLHSVIVPKGTLPFPVAILDGLKLDVKFKNGGIIIKKQ